MRIELTGGQQLHLDVSTLLMPSDKQGEWAVVHVMRPGRTCLHGKQPQEAADGETSDTCPAVAPTKASLLTSREREVLRLLAAGTSTENVSERLHLSRTTVRNHIQHLLAKLEVHSRVEAVAYAHRHQLS